MAGQPAPRRRSVNRGTFLGFVLGAAVVLLAGGALLFLPVFGIGPLVRGGPGVPPLSAQERRGQEIYVANCQSCHGGPTGGAMMDYPPRHNANGHTWHHPDCELKQVIREGGNEMTEMMREMMAPPDAPRMQALKDRLSDDAINAVLAFIKTMWTPVEREAQEVVTKESCAVVRG